ncbi:MAG: hypothetical protein HOP23_06655 [Methylococcaceae bacterium]|nr:hypothetical protein [Methylococcaceae bacterium]
MNRLLMLFAILGWALLTQGCVAYPYPFYSPPAAYYGYGPAYGYSTYGYRPYGFYGYAPYGGFGWVGRFGRGGHHGWRHHH